MTDVSNRNQLAYIAAQASDARVNVEFETNPSVDVNLSQISRTKPVSDDRCP